MRITYVRNYVLRYVLRTFCAAMLVVLCTLVTMATFVDATDSSSVTIVAPTKHESVIHAPDMNIYTDIINIHDCGYM